MSSYLPLDYRQIAMRSAFIGIFSGILQQYQNGDSSAFLPFINMQVSPGVYVGSAMTVGSLIGEELSHQILPWVQNQLGSDFWVKYQTILEPIVNPSVTGLTMVALGKLIGAEDDSKQTFINAGLLNGATGYVYDNWVKNYVQTY